MPLSPAAAVPIYGFNLSNTVAHSGTVGGGIVTGKPDFEDFGIVKDIDQLSVRVGEAAALGRNIQRADIQISHRQGPSRLCPTASTMC